MGPQTGEEGFAEPSRTRGQESIYDSPRAELAGAWHRAEPRYLACEHTGPAGAGAPECIIRLEQRHSVP